MRFWILAFMMVIKPIEGKAEPELKVGVAADSGFFAHLQNGELQGIDLDVMKEICADNGWRCTFGATRFQQVLSEAVGFEVVDDKVDSTKPVERKWDLVIGALDAKSSRLRFMGFSDPYFAGRHLFYKRVGAAAPKFHAPSGFPLPGPSLKIAVEKGSALARELSLVYGKMPRSGVEILEFQSIDQLGSMLERKQVSLVFTFTGSGESRQAELLQIEPASALLGVVDAGVVRGVGVGVSHQAPNAVALTAKLNQSIRKLLGDCKSNQGCRYRNIIRQNAGELPFDPNPVLIPEVRF